MRIYKKRISMDKNQCKGNEVKTKDLFFPVEGVRFEDLHDWKADRPEVKRSSMKLHCTRHFTGTMVIINEKTIALFRFGERVYAMDDKCPHQGGPLHLGDIENIGMWEKMPCVVCPWHSWTFSLETGDIQRPLKKGSLKLQVYPVKILDNGQLLIAFDSFDPSYFDGKVDF